MMKNAEFKDLIQKAKEKSILEYLKAQGEEPAKISGDNFWFNSPIRSGDKTPSFKVNARLNRWYDFCHPPQKGDIIDLVGKMEGISFTMAVNKLSNSRIHPFSFFGGKKDYQPAEAQNTQQSQDKKKQGKGISLRKIQDLRNPALIEYIKSRGIPLETARANLKEAYYFVGSKHYFAVAFGNDKGGCELRNKYFKGGLSPKSITTKS